MKRLVIRLTTKRNVPFYSNHPSCSLQVTEERGWKKVTTPFDLPPTCTNSAFVVKQLYQRHLYNWEQVQVHGKSLGSLPKRPFENESASGAEREKRVYNKTGQHSIKGRLGSGE